ncbi:MAG: tetratricopeptide repeat protein [Planctomycetota bacterium JB042]
MVDPSEFGFEFDDADDAWMDRVREAESPREPGRIGPYELLEEVGRGGQGVVFRARRRDTGRVLALKRLAAGAFATASMRRRFEREVEAAAALEHPNIVEVVGVEFVDGVPILAMEWIDGVPATEWAAGAGAGGGARREPADVLGRFLEICDAVAHAHRRGVLHRDLKPSNILIDGDGRPHVLDFGLAKRFDPDGGEVVSEGLTRSSGFVGTPRYASPEQVRASGGRLDGRTDVYSLGVLLFEMLTGESPYGPVTDIGRLVRAIETGETPRLSTADPRLGRDLDVVVRRATAREVEDRTPTVDALAADVRRVLAGEPILATPPSGWSVLRRLVRRHRLAFASAAAIALFVVALAVVLFVQNRRVRRERDLAVEARTEAQESRARAESILGFLLGDVLSALDQMSPFHRSQLGEIVDAAAERARSRFADEPEVEAAVLRTIGELCRSHGRYERAEELMRRSVDLFRARGAAGTADAMRSSLGLARVLVRRHRLDDAEALLRESIADLRSSPAPDRTVLATALSDLSVVLFQRNDFDAARDATEQSIAAYREVLGPRHPYVGVGLLNLSRVLLHQRRFEEAEDSARRAGEILDANVGEDHPLRAQVELRLGAALGHLDAPEEAERHFRRGLARQRRALGDDHPDLANTLHEFALFLLAHGRADEGIAMFEDAVRMQVARLGPDDPFVKGLEARLAEHRRAAAASDDP